MMYMILRKIEWILSIAYMLKLTPSKSKISSIIYKDYQKMKSYFLI